MLRPVLLHVGSPELPAFSLFGISMVAILSGKAPIRGLIVAGLGVMLALIGADHSGLTRREVLTRAAAFFGYLLLFMVLMAVIGFLPAIPVFVTVYMRLEGKESWKHVVGQSIGLVGFMYVIFDRILNLPWPASLLGQWIPVLRMIPSM